MRDSFLPLPLLTCPKFSLPFYPDSKPPWSKSEPPASLQVISSDLYQHLLDLSLSLVSFNLFLKRQPDVCVSDVCVQKYTHVFGYVCTRSGNSFPQKCPSTPIIFITASTVFTQVYSTDLAHPPNRIFHIFSPDLHCPHTYFPCSLHTLGICLPGRITMWCDLRCSPLSCPLDCLVQPWLLFSSPFQCLILR